MKRKNIIVALAIIALSVTQIMALELNTPINKEMTKEIKATITQELASQAQQGKELPDYKNLNQMFIAELERRAFKNSSGALTGLFVQELHYYHHLLNTLETQMEYNKNNKEDILFDIRRLDNYLQYIPSNERKKYVDYLCKKDRYFLKAKNSIVNMTFLVNKSKADIREGDLLKCVREQKPEKIKLHKNDSF